MASGRRSDGFAKVQEAASPLSSSLPNRAPPPDRIARRSIFRAGRQALKFPPPNLWNPLNTTHNAFNPPSRQKNTAYVQADRSRIRNLSESNHEYPLLLLPPQTHNPHTASSLVVECASQPPPPSPSHSLGLHSSAIQASPDQKGKGKQAVFEPPLRGTRQDIYQNSNSSHPLPPLPLQMEATKYAQDPTTSKDSLPLNSLPPPSLPAKDSPPQSRNGPNPPFPAHPQHLTNGHKPPLVTNDPERDAGASPTPSIPWTDRHPCYPHPNPHVPLSSPLYKSTRIIRIPRDWMIVGDMAPTYSNTYPEVLAPWVSEQDFRLLVGQVNDALIKAMDPWALRNWIDAVLGLATGWLWEDFGMPSARKKVRQVEALIKDWNAQRRKGGRDGEAELVRVVELRKTAYMSLDFQIPDPGLPSAARAASTINRQDPATSQAGGPIAPGARPDFAEEGTERHW
ncbi:hypothetical protein MMC13_007340 [Lambiella insularis]|nr:hypothetical protein [Lambiella insularis]